MINIGLALAACRLRQVPDHHLLGRLLWAYTSYKADNLDSVLACRYGVVRGR